MNVTSTKKSTDSINQNSSQLHGIDHIYHIQNMATLSNAVSVSDEMESQSFGEYHDHICSIHFLLHDCLISVSITDINIKGSVDTNDWFTFSAITSVNSKSLNDMESGKGEPSSEELMQPLILSRQKKSYSQHQDEYQLIRYKHFHPLHVFLIPPLSKPLTFYYDHSLVHSNDHKQSGTNDGLQGDFQSLESYVTTAHDISDHSVTLKSLSTTKCLSSFKTVITIKNNLPQRLLVKISSQV
jgi:hypothetical protein